MSINPYTLQCLYEKGILDYVPTDLTNGTNVSATTYSNFNPYLQMAAQGNLYQNYNNAHDSFTHSSNYVAGSPITPVYGNYGNNNGFKTGFHSNSNILSAYSPQSVGMYSNTNALGINSNIGTKSNAGAINSYGELGDTVDSMADGINKTVSLINNTPKLLRNIFAGGIALLGIVCLFKRKKTPKNINKSESFLSKFNLIKYFKKK